MFILNKWESNLVNWCTSSVCRALNRLEESSWHSFAVSSYTWTIVHSSRNETELKDRTGFIVSVSYVYLMKHLVQSNHHWLLSGRFHLWSIKDSECLVSLRAWRSDASHDRKKLHDIFWTPLSVTLRQHTEPGIAAVQRRTSSWVHFSS